MNVENGQIGWGLWLRWMLASAAGLAVGFAVYFPLVVGFASEQSLVEHILLSIAGGAVLGAVIGSVQWLVLRRLLSQLARWVWATAAGGAVGGTVAVSVGSGVGESMGFVTALVVGGALLGASLGLAQWFLLRRQLAQVGWWVLASTLGLAMGLALGRGVGEIVAFAVSEAMRDVAGTVTFAIFLFVGYGGTMGAVLVWLLQQPYPAQVDPLKAAE